MTRNGLIRGNLGAGIARDVVRSPHFDFDVERSASARSRPVLIVYQSLLAAVM
jgi:hypothetical protein